MLISVGPIYSTPSASDYLPPSSGVPHPHPPCFWPSWSFTPTCATLVYTDYLDPP